MGRPPLGLEMTTIRLPKSMGSRIDAVLVGREKRSALIRFAIERELERREAVAKASTPKASETKNKPGRN
jgi:metal-responsive CopG/Arc/MetJ family transcriptional regulator